MGEPGRNLNGSIDSEGDDLNLLRGLEAFLGQVDAGDVSHVDLEVPGSVDTEGARSGARGGLAESSTMRVATDTIEAAANSARRVQRTPSSPPRVESAVTGVGANRSEVDPNDADAAPPRRVSARTG